jgi:hypothetical protein
MTDRELMQQALDALESDCDATKFGASEALRARLAQPEPEPVAWMHDSHVGFNVPLYTAPPQREWQGLTDDERTYIAWESNNGPECVAMTEAKLKEKNT